MAKVDKGNKGAYSYVPWNETVGLLTRVFGPFGWSAEITASYSDTERGIYRTDLKLTVRVLDDETGEVLEVSRPGTGANQANPLSHEDSIKGSRSDAISVAAKSLGDAFGLFLYDKGDPARTSTANNASRGAATARKPAGTATAGTRKAAGSSTGNGPSEKQMNVFLDNGYEEEEIGRMGFRGWKTILDAIFAAGRGNFDRAPYEAGEREAAELPF